MCSSDLHPLLRGCTPTAPRRSSSLLGSRAASPAPVPRRSSSRRPAPSPPPPGSTPSAAFCPDGTVPQRDAHDLQLTPPLPASGQAPAPVLPSTTDAGVLEPPWRLVPLLGSVLSNLLLVLGKGQIKVVKCSLLGVVLGAVTSPTVLLFWSCWCVPCTCLSSAHVVHVHWL